MRQFERRDVVCRKDDPADGLYLLFSGQLQVMDVAENGHEIGLNLIKPGAFFGELSVIDSRARSAHIMALEFSTVGVVPQAAARALFCQMPATAEAMMMHLAAMVRSLTDFRVLLALPSAFHRVYALLNQMKRKMPGGLIVIQQLPKQHEIAIMLNTSRETVSRAITSLAAEGVVEKDFRRLIVRRPDRLGELARLGESATLPSPSVAAASKPQVFARDS